jgi:long-chain acyl-CoA synthetase
MTYNVDVLPMYLEGTYDVLPKGSVFPKGKELKVRIGPALMFEDMKKRTAGMARSESYRHVTRLAEESVKALKAGKVLGSLDATDESIRTERPRRTSGGNES